ncbi:MAG: hypothetical protein AAF502_17960 [Bacteroidota bacterium]
MKLILTEIAKTNSSVDYQLLKELVEKIRPAKSSDSAHVAEQLHNLIAHLKSDPKLTKSLSLYLSRLFSKHDPVHLYTTAGILKNKGLINEIWTKLKHKILPHPAESWDMSALLQQLFPKKDDHLWLKAVPHKLWAELMSLTKVPEIFSNHQDSCNALNSSIQLLSHNIAALGLDYEITRNLPDNDKKDVPFLRQNNVLNDLFDLTDKDYQSGAQHQLYEQLNNLLDLCLDRLRQLRESKNVHGTSLHLLYISRRLLQQVKRMQLLLKLREEKQPDAFCTNLLKLALTLVRATNEANSIRKLINDTSDLLAFEIVEHSAFKGGKYIANDLKEYFGYLKASMLGGFIIAFFATFKIFIDGLTLSPLGQGLLFSLNYSLCFVLVYVWGGIIATKQPAMTASAVARSMDQNNDGAIDNLNGLKDMIIKVSRSQFISFVGNLICAFPIAFLLAKAYGVLFNTPFINPGKMTTLVTDIDPGASGAIFYAAIAGVFLSLSGLISGYFDNKVLFSNIPERIKGHPLLSRWVSNKRLEAIANYTRKNLGVMSGNISLGFFLGMAGTVGFITGLPIDIRHIAFSSANFGFAVESGTGVLTLSTILISITGLLAIGFMNFIVSFGMTLFVAIKSRKITFGQTSELTKLLGYHFLHAPLDFFFQPGKWIGFGKFNNWFRNRNTITNSN